MHYSYAADKAVYSTSMTYHYKSRWTSLLDAVVDAAEQEFIYNIAPEHWYFGGDAELVYSDNRQHKPYDETKLSGLPLYSFHRLGYRYCPDDTSINTTKGECVIDGLLAFLRTHYTSMTAAQLKRELGSANPSVDDIAEWIQDDAHDYLSYVSLYILDPFRRKMFSHVARVNTKVMMTFFVNHQHVYAITSKELRKKIQHYDCLNLTKLDYRDTLMTDNHDYCPNIERLSDCKKPYVLVESGDLSDLARQLQTETKMMIPQLSFTGYYRVTRFEHPTTQQIIIAADKYDIRKDVAMKLLASTGYSGFEFVNQSFCQLARMSFKIHSGELPVETYGPDQIDILENSPVIPFTCRTGNVCDDYDNHVSIDVRHAYTARLIHNKDDYPVFSFADKKERYDQSMGLPVGEFYINKQIHLAIDNAVVRHGWHPRTFIKHCLDKGYITLDDITFVMKASGYLAADTFKAWALHTRKQFPSSPSKRSRTAFEEPTATPTTGGRFDLQQRIDDEDDELSSLAGQFGDQSIRDVLDLN